MPEGRVIRVLCAYDPKWFIQTFPTFAANLFAMIPNLPISVSISFMFIALITVWALYEATNRSRALLFIAAVWLVVQTVLGMSGFYTVTNTVPPRFALLGLPPLALIIAVFATPKGRRFVDSLDLKKLTFLHTIRILVELMLLNLSIHKLVPQLMTFEGRNFDIISGVTAPFMFYLVFVRRLFGRKTLLVWNIICLGLLLNIVINAVLSLPSPFQQFGFEQPNVAILYFPFVWLPCGVVPIVLFAHLVAIRQLLSKNKFDDSLRVTLINQKQGMNTRQ